ncbi:hypothetical protein [Kangiella shandongensis]|uniref:hypothetical protein n=1 Tax=Kangiella shandongensis TaxID=2763258 RepID=UPI001CC14B55|nr:hypothetical protein [Kangiella shandongensis]
MSTVTILAGDFPRGTGHFTFRNFTLPGDEEHYLCETVCITQVEFLNEATPKMALLLNKDPELTEEIHLELEEKIRIADEDDVFFMVRLADQRRFIAETDQATYDKIKNSLEELSLTPASYLGNRA